jgi:hypothetical protein
MTCWRRPGASNLGWRGMLVSHRGHRVTEIAIRNEDLNALKSLFVGPQKSFENGDAEPYCYDAFLLNLLHCFML